MADVKSGNGSAAPGDPPRAETPASQSAQRRMALLATAVGHTRFIVLIGVAAVLLIAAALFVLGTGLALAGIVGAFYEATQGRTSEAKLTVRFLEIVSVMLKAVFFYLIGVGLYSLFIAPLNLPAALGVETLNDLESKVVSVIIVILAVTFLEHFIQWQQALEVLYFGVALALVVFSLVLFQFHSHRAKRDQTRNAPAIEERAQVQLFMQGKEHRDLGYEEELGEAERQERLRPNGDRRANKRARVKANGRR